MGRPAFVPTPEQREDVDRFSVVGCSHEQIAALLGIGLSTLRRHFKKELEEFRDSILNNTRTVVSEMDGLMAMDVAHQILEKIGNNVITH